MSFEYSPACLKEKVKLEKKFRSLSHDMERLEKIIALNPLGQSQHRTILHKGDDVCIVKGHLFCQTLRRDSLRIIYAYHGTAVTVVWIEMYHKGDRENEDRERIEEYLRSLQE